MGIKLKMVLLQIRLFVRYIGEMLLFLKFPATWYRADTGINQFVDTNH